MPKAISFVYRETLLETSLSIFTDLTPSSEASKTEPSPVRFERPEQQQTRYTVELHSAYYQYLYYKLMWFSVKI